MLFDYPLTLPCQHAARRRWRASGHELKINIYSLLLRSFTATIKNLSKHPPCLYKKCLFVFQSQHHYRTKWNPSSRDPVSSIFSDHWLSVFSSPEHYYSFLVVRFETIFCRRLGSICWGNIITHFKTVHVAKILHWRWRGAPSCGYLFLYISPDRSISRGKSQAGNYWLWEVNGWASSILKALTIDQKMTEYISQSFPWTINSKKKEWFVWRYNG